MIREKCTPEEMELISKIADRACKGEKKWKLNYFMDIETVHLRIGLLLAELLAAEDFDFFHDIYGINGYLNRETGELRDGFIPRFASNDIIVDTGGISVGYLDASHIITSDIVFDGKTQIQELHDLAKPLSDWLYKNGNPHSQIVITQANVELFSAEICAPFKLRD